MDAKYNKEIYKIKAILDSNGSDNGDVYNGYYTSSGINPYTICRNTGIKINNGDNEEEYLYEYDLIEFKEGFNQNKLYGYVFFDEDKYHKTYGSYAVKTSNEYPTIKSLFDCRDFKVVGNVILNEEDIKVIDRQDNRLLNQNPIIDTSDCRSTQYKNKLKKRFLPK
jgi:hypothetical protein